eukprot:g1349.t1
MSENEDVVRKVVSTVIEDSIFSLLRAATEERLNATSPSRKSPRTTSSSSPTNYKFQERQKAERAEAEEKFKKDALEKKKKFAKTTELLRRAQEMENRLTAQGERDASKILRERLNVDTDELELAKKAQQQVKRLQEEKRKRKERQRRKEMREAERLAREMETSELDKKIERERAERERKSRLALQITKQREKRQQEALRRKQLAEQAVVARKKKGKRGSKKLPLYLRMQQEFEAKQSKEIMERDSKIRQRKKRETGYNPVTIEEHRRNYDALKQLNHERERMKARQREKLWVEESNRFYQGKYNQEIKLKIRDDKESKARNQAEMKFLRNKRRKYAELVREMFFPEIDQKKRTELAQRKENLANPAPGVLHKGDGLVRIVKQIVDNRHNVIRRPREKRQQNAPIYAPKNVRMKKVPNRLVENQNDDMLNGDTAQRVILGLTAARPENKTERTYNNGQHRVRMMHRSKGKKYQPTPDDPSMHDEEEEPDAMTAHLRTLVAKAKSENQSSDDNTENSDPYEQEIDQLSRMYMEAVKMKFKNLPAE